MWRTFHRWLAIVLVIPLVVWSITGLLFHLKPGWSRAYDLLLAERPAMVHLDRLVLPAGTTHVEAFATAIGPLARVTTDRGDELYDLDSGTRRSPLAIDAAKALAVDAIHRSKYASSYGELGTVTSTDASVTIQTTGGPVISVGRNDARISQRGPDTERIDWLYRIHYLQWTGLGVLDKVLAVVGLGLIWLVMIPGIVLFVRRR